MQIHIHAYILQIYYIVFQTSQEKIRMVDRKPYNEKPLHFRPSGTIYMYIQVCIYAFKHVYMDLCSNIIVIYYEII
jgi:hypothetical protein